jgi:ribosome maturation factor RimP
MRGESRHVPSRPRPAGRATGRAASGAASGRDSAAETARLTQVLEPVVQAAGLDLESVRVAAAGRRRLLRVVVDADGGPGLDDIANVSRSLSAELDNSGVMGEIAYTLEVSSPGVDRPLTAERHWRRAQGRLVRVPLAPGAPGYPDGGPARRGGPGDRRPAAGVRLSGIGTRPGAGRVRQWGRNARRARGRGGARWTLT